LTVVVRFEILIYQPNTQVIDEVRKDESNSHFILKFKRKMK